MTCRVTRSPDGSVAVIACSRGSTSRCGCGNEATKLCDFPLRGRREGDTCSAPLCSKCAHVMPGGLDYCRPHHEIDS